ncbi:DUF4974 domain-containing protein [Chitinophaga sp. G-6-1-13]|uniref:DUF4974 domain-containing protein n=1 Tax=Chitinophaga fulva TaxID=2728842 RepID=A0A848GKT2_9BACT|nr:FecR domain-containing protein [Chitinophaga fulva]NML37310.1 DUF4974 domain-containing protein [Chitinophaga fulva]
MDFSEEEIYELITKFLSGEATPDEAMQLEEWKEESIDHSEFYAHAVRLWEQVSGDASCPESTNKAWEKLAGKKTGNNKKKFTLKVILKVAAAVILMVSAGALLFKINHTPQREYSIMLDAGNNFLRDTLPDNSIVVLDKQSGFQYGADDNSRKAILKGQAWFCIQGIDGKPFEIETRYFKIKVLGTTFHVSVEKEFQSVTVTNGAVLLITPHDTLLVSANQKGCYLPSSGRLTLYRKIDINEMAYATHQFYFDDTRLEDICAKLASVYGRKMVIADESLKSMRMTAEFQNESLQDIMVIIAQTLHVHFKQTNDSIIIHEKNSD